VVIPSRATQRGGSFVGLGIGPAGGGAYRVTDIFLDGAARGEIPLVVRSWTCRRMVTTTSGVMHSATRKTHDIDNQDGAAPGPRFRALDCIGLHAAEQAGGDSATWQG